MAVVEEVVDSADSLIVRHTNKVRMGVGGEVVEGGAADSKEGNLDHVLKITTFRSLQSSIFLQNVAELLLGEEELH